MRDETIVTIINHPDDTGAHRRPKEACLVVISGTDLGRKYTIGPREMTLGRATTSDICISQDSVSRTHAKIFTDDQGVKLRDNDSTNGTVVNDGKITETYLLRDGDLIKIGRQIFKFLSGDNIESLYHEEIYRLSTVDGLTQVFNKRYFVEALDREINRARRYGRALSLMMFDIDHFKRCNDTFGHRAGDHVLRQVADLVRKRARAADIVARYGGEEFAVILPEVDVRGAAMFAESVRQAIAREVITFEERTIPVTISIGVSQLDASIKRPDDLVSAADARLYKAKEGGRNRVIWCDNLAAVSG